VIASGGNGDRNRQAVPCRPCRWLGLAAALVFGLLGLASETVALESLGAGFADLQVAVAEQLGRSDAVDPLAAEPAYRRLSGLLAADSGRPELERYWQDFVRALELRRERHRLMETVLDPISIQLRMKLQRLIGADRPWAAAVASDAVIGILLVHQAATRFAANHEPGEIERVRPELAAVRRRFGELGTLPKDAPTRELLFELGTLLESYQTTLARVVEVTGEEGGLIRKEIPARAEQLRLSLEALEQARTASAAVAAPVAVPMPVSMPVSIPGPTPMSEPPSPTTAEPGQGRAPGGVVPPPAEENPARAAPAPAPAMAWPLLTVLGLGLLGLGGAAGWWLRPRTPATAVTVVGPAEPMELQEAGVGGVPATDWVNAMGRAMLLLQATGSELDRLRQHSAAVQQELSEARDRAQSANRAMSAFLDRLGDHLRGPAGLIVSQGDSLLAALERAGQGELAAEVESLQWSGEQLVRLTDGLRDLARIEAGTLGVELESFTLDQLLAEVRERLAPLVALYGVTLVVEPLEGEPAPLHTDYAKLRAALIHLLENACKFGENGAVTLVAGRQSAEGQPPMVRFAVSDQGPGISRERRERIFDAFVGFGGGRQAGAGIGLSLVRHYAELLGGSIDLDSKPGEGACFILCLPADYQPPPTPERLAPAPPRALAYQPVEEPAPAPV
jgi:signal transduction histidine kinase